MIFEQYYLDCLSQASYLVGDETTGRAVVVDPRRDVDVYVDDAAAAGLSIELVIETHFHADFLSGHLELARRTGAEIAYGEAAGTTEFPSRKLADGERISLGDVTLEVRATPGHTPESISIVVYEHGDDDTPWGVLTGDTLFIGDVGRPDLLASVGRTPQELGHMLYDSLHTKLMTLPGSVRVFPAHGAGSACGKNLSTETQSTIGEQLRTNYALADVDRDDFVALVTEGQPAAPGYFLYDASRNRQLRPLLQDQEAPAAITLDGLVAARDAGAVVLDTRSPEDFARGHVVGSVNVGLGGRFAEYAGSVAGPDDRIVLVCEPGTEVEAKVRLARIGYDQVVGALGDPYPAMQDHPEHVGVASRLTASALADVLVRPDRGVQLVDVRNPGEVAGGTIPGAVHIPLARLRLELDTLDPGAPTVVYCAGGYRSSIAASLLRARGFVDVSDLVGGYGAWTTTRPTSAPAP
ncbi:MAG TPA: rhodanese-like domain-containing protein [Acidimicrobiales bacterium]|nr:rhodanese-like domain-containing protein [Acidimicrobiales bacterium]